MSAAYAAADRLLDGAVDRSGDALVEATAGVGQAILALVDVVEPVVELLREQLARGADEGDGPRCVSCGVRRSVHAVPVHEWNGGGSATTSPAPPDPGVVQGGRS